MIKRVPFLIFLILIPFPSFVLAKAQSKSKVVSKVDGLEVRVESDQPGTVIVENNNGKVKIKTSQGITPTIFISDKKITPTIVEIVPQEEGKVEQKKYFQERKTVLGWIKNFLSSILNFLFSR